ncbi:hypothetical protein GCM10023156_08300 [Novipirellula rosea]|uniref:Reverse transcriptase N-terminal domain-containing protein n=1 Tax=Novipirellula rosea TaxID=1031540 RepID=A0ABP8MC04_9BACT
MQPTEIGVFGLDDVLANAMAKVRHHRKVQEPWTRALHNCINAQRIRCRRALRMQTDAKSRLSTMDWHETLTKAIVSSRQRTTSQLETGSWKRALDNKLTSVKQRKLLASLNRK